MSNPRTYIAPDKIEFLEGKYWSDFKYMFNNENEEGANWTSVDQMMRAKPIDELMEYIAIDEDRLDEEYEEWLEGEPDYDDQYTIDENGYLIASGE